ncbi:hypothetical protein GQX73_g5275 [Xylaria multiplex]|uniref:Fe2OG dioxygenase domain-containing protein n=1 Tax=Xylaria multiplex TaxID=323545 RepID=A0A7C8N786_9PEZI|nr:hypothetical protein GQX73_g5275 [Xylaria multiplex]
MFPIDTAVLPSLATRKALLVVDAQNDFLAEDGALPVIMPVDLAQRISDLARDFRGNGGEIIWVQSQFESPRPVEEEQIMISDMPSSSASAAPSRGRRSRTAPPVTEPASSPEAFLTPDGKGRISCVRAGAPGTEMHPLVKQAVGPRDHVLTKKYYSAFKAEGLLGLLRVRFVTELFICGSLTNIGVMATAIEAASYGFTIIIVDDCCGSQSMSRHRTALRQITSMTGCDTLSAANVLNMTRPRPSSSERGGQQRQHRHRDAAGGRSPTVRVRRGRGDAVAPSASDIQPSLERLSLSGEPAAADEHAPTAITPSSQQRGQRRSRRSKSRSRSRSRARSPTALQPMARPDHPQAKNRTDQDTVTAAPRTRLPTTNNTTTNSNNADVSAAAASQSKNANDSRHESVRRDEQEEIGDPPRRGSISSSLSKRRSQQSPPSQSQSTSPLSAPPLLELHPNNTNNAKKNVNAVNKERNKSKGVENTLTRTQNANSSGSSKDLFESSETSSTPINTTSKATGATSSSPPLLLSHGNSLTNPNNNNSKIKSSTMKTKAPLPQEDAQSAPLCEGDTKVIYNILPESLCNDIFGRIESEVAWQRMSHQGGQVPRLVAVQGVIEADGSKPIYRFPADESPPLRPFTPAVDAIRAVVEKKLGHPLNHVLIQLYRTGTDYISEHSDKTLDIVRDSFIANVSLGAERTMTLRTKRRPKRTKSRSPKGRKAGFKTETADSTDDSPKRDVQRARLPHNSLFQMGLATNAHWLHAIRQDKRAPRDKASAELAYDEARISLTFRQIGTYLSADEELIWGQGAKAKTREKAGAVANGLSDDAIAMLRAFGRENQDPTFVWEDHYGPGFDVLHITTAKRLFLSENDNVVNLRLRALMAELGISYARGSLSGGDDEGKRAVDDIDSGVKLEMGKEKSTSNDVPVKFVDNDDAKTMVVGQQNIMLYIEATYGDGNTANEKGIVSERFEQGLEFLDLWRSTSFPPLPSPPSNQNEKEKEKETDKGTKDKYIEKVTRLLAPWEEYAAEAAFIAGPEPSLPDFSFWPVLHDILSSSPFLYPPPSPELEDRGGEGAEKRKGGDALQLPHLRVYYDRMRAREAIAQVLG